MTRDVMKECEEEKRDEEEESSQQKRKRRGENRGIREKINDR